VNFGFWGSEPQTLNLRYRWYGGICRGGGVWSCGERIFRLALSVPEIYDLKVLPFDLICIKTGSGRGQMTSSPGRGRRGLPSLAETWFCGFAFRRYSTLNFLPISPKEKMSTDFFYDRRQKNTIDGVDKKLLRNWSMLPNDNILMSVGHLDHVLLTVYSSIKL